MKKLYLFIFFIILFLPIKCFALEFPDFNSKYVEVYDLNDHKIIYEENSNEVVSIASLTKIATTITAIETIDNLDEVVTITDEILSTVRWDASIAGLNVGDELSYRDLLYASMLPSGADATNSIAISSSGSIDEFVNKMNNLVTKIGLKNTHFVNVTGLDSEGHYSTTDEVRLLLEYSLKNDLFREIYTTKEYTLSNGLLVKSTLYKYNANDDALVKILGSKTGYTGEAGYCLSALSNINGHEVITLVLGAEHNYFGYFNIIDTYNLINFLLDHFTDRIIVYNEQLVHTIPISYSKDDLYEIYADKELLKYLPDDYDHKRLQIIYDGVKILRVRKRKGYKIGTITYLFDNKEIYKQDIILDVNNKISFKKVFDKYYYIINVVIFLTIVYFLLRYLFRKNKKKKIKKAS